MAASSSPPAMQSLLRTLYARSPSIGRFAGNWAMAPARSPWRGGTRPQFFPRWSRYWRRRTSAQAHKLPPDFRRSAALKEQLREHACRAGHQ